MRTVFLAIAVLLCLLVATSVATSPVFVEDFESEDWQSRWTIISNERYTGEWKVETAEEAPEEIKHDKGLVMQHAARHHAIIAPLSPPLESKPDAPFVVQYEVKLQHGLDCGGAYLKLINRKDLGPDGSVAQFGEKTDYVVMFGPDKCGSDTKVHFILRHLNPLTNQYEEKHVINPPPVPFDKRTHIYTLVIHPNNSFSVMVDLEDYRVGDLLDDFAPPVNPPRTIDDPTDIKPESWIDDEEIPDPSATKPDTWDETLPEEIPDLEAEMPEGWLENENEEIVDLQAERPEDWNVEEDGEWTPPTIPNPKCYDAPGCGPWELPMIPNPDYMGEWRAPLIPNPEYKGPWVARQIPNPNFYEDLHPSALLPIDAIGIEVWTMTDAIMLDNIYVGNDLEAALEYGKATWGEKVGPEMRLEAAENQTDTFEDFMDTFLGYFEGQDTLLYILVSVVCGLATSAVFAIYCVGSKKAVLQPRDKVVGVRREDETQAVTEPAAEGLKKRKTPALEKKTE